MPGKRSAPFLFSVPLHKAQTTQRDFLLFRGGRKPFNGRSCPARFKFVPCLQNDQPFPRPTFCSSHNFIVPPSEYPSERLGTLETRALNLRLDSSLVQPISREFDILGQPHPKGASCSIHLANKRLLSASRTLHVGWSPHQGDTLCVAFAHHYHSTPYSRTWYLDINRLVSPA